jgi:UDP-N-acetylglucosamine--N-acetylmuramyl-(pentapeptide) pyrophosphoryl-undecaprenol N-acetylglucosamine transferase
MPLAFRQRLQVTQQCRPEDIDRVRASYANHGIAADLSTYIEDMPEKLGWAHLVIARAGASTIAELTAAGRPAILIPLPSATDDHQTHNVREMVAAGGARAIAQANFTSTELAKQMQKLALEPGALENAAARAKSVGRPDATSDLADLVESTGGAGLMAVINVGAGSASRSARSTSLGASAA